MFQISVKPEFCSAASLVSFRWLLAVGTIIGTALAAGSSSARADAPTIRLRVEWTAESPATWAGGVTVDGGTASNPASLGTGTSDVGTIWISSGAVRFQRRSPATEDGVEFSVTGSADSTLHVIVRPAGTTAAVEPIEVRTSDLFHKPAVFETLGNRPRIVIRRAPGDALGLRFDRPHLVFDPQETFHAAVVLNLLEDRSPLEKTVKAHVRWKLYPQGGSWSIADGSAQVSATINSPRTTEVPLELRLPGEEGIYQLRLSATGRGFDDVERQVQLVVLEPSSPASVSPQVEKVVDAFDLMKGGAARRVSNLAGKKRFDRPLGRLWKRGRPDQETSQTSDGPANWEAFRLHANHVDRAHRLRLYPSKSDGRTNSAEQTIGVCVFEPDGQGGLRQISPDLRWNLSEGQDGFPELIFWPHEREPIVLVHGPGDDSAPTIDRVELSEIGEHLPLSGNLSSLDQLQYGRRLCGPYLSRPYLAQNFSAPQAFDVESQRACDDWQTFLLAGRRLVESLKMQKANALLLTVAAEGSTLYPSRRLEPSARFDSGTISPSGRDPIRKDVLELLLRMFDREELVLIPELQFTEPLPVLERKLRERNPNLAGIRLVDADGRGWAEVFGSSDSGVPWYNPLDERVQQAVIDVVRELAERYRDHPGFGGVACELNPRGYLQYPGIEWGYDLPTIERFAQSARVRVPGGTDPEGRRERYEYLTTTVRREWLAWRAAEIGRFHGRIAAAVAEAAPQARFLFTGSGLATDLAGRELSAAEMVRTTANPVQQLLLRGINFSQAPLGERVTAMRPVWNDSTGDPLGKAALLTLNQSPGIDAAYRGNRSGTLFYSLPDVARIQNCGALFDQRTTELALPSQTVSDEIDLRRRYAHALGTLDSQMIFEGGGMLPLTNSKSAASIRRAFSRLPATSFQPLAAQTQPAIIRTARFDDATWLCLVNSTALPATGELVLACPPETTCLDLSNDKAVTLQGVGPSRSRLEWELGPHAVWCCRISDPNAAVHDVKAVLPGPVLAGLRQQIDQLNSRMNVIAELSRSSVAAVANAGFEESGGDLAEVVGWDGPNAGETAWNLDEVNPRSGRRALRISAEGSRTELVSPPLPLLGVQHATLSLWMRSDRSTARVELTFEGRKDDRGRSQRQVVEVGKNWRKYEFRVTNPPTRSPEQPRLRVQPLSSCKLWIDDLELDAQALSADDVRQLTKTVSALRLAWEQGRYADCQRLLEGYWGRLLLDDQSTPAPRPAAEERLGTRPRTSPKR